MLPASPGAGVRGPGNGPRSRAPGPRQSASQLASVAVFGSFCLALPFILSSSMTDAALSLYRLDLESRLAQKKAFLKERLENDGESQGL